MWYRNWRDDIWNTLDQDWDMVIVGGGITGAGILREAARLGLKALLIEQNDFAYGTSSRSSKLVHGGLRYLKQGKLGLTRASVLERERLQTAAPGLVDPLGFLLANFKGEGQRREKALVSTGLSFYDMMALQWSHQYVSPQEVWMLAPRLKVADMAGAFHYLDAQTDDARLVLRVLREAVRDGGTAVNYVRATQLIREDGQVVGLTLCDEVVNREAEVRAKVVINATGAWADQLRQKLGKARKLRPLRGSHIILPQWRLPVAQAVSFNHPVDGRFVFIFPWDGVTMVGTTDVDHTDGLDVEPHITPDEVAYLMAAIESRYPSLEIRLDDVISTFAGVRPVIDTGKADPSKEARDHVVWQEDGLLTVTGGKLTTFRLIALDALKAVRQLLPEMPEVDEDAPTLDEVVVDLLVDLPDEVRQRLNGRYGHDASALIDAAQAGELDLIPGTMALWAELRWASRAEGVVHLSDLLLRRVRLGLFLTNGGAHLHNQIRRICQSELGWDDAKWSDEWTAYLDHWQSNYSLPEWTSIPNWHDMLPPPQSVAESDSRFAWAGLLMGVAAFLFGIFWLRRQDNALR
ncbi:MAG: glycerol-3-phosphate dehydrogenase/oxidase [Chloroflexi bacterium]|nr:glycerol-3-phosphate dehydrogenase/oxidase [Chloroflexota bacterium]